LVANIQYSKHEVDVMVAELKETHFYAVFTVKKTKFRVENTKFREKSENPKL
jgi:hypothetical protein